MRYSGGIDFCPRVDCAQTLAVVRINQTKFELRYARELVPRFLDLGGVEPGNLHQDPVRSDRTDDRFAAAEVIHAFADDFDRLVEHSFASGSCPRSSAGSGTKCRL